MDGLRIGPWQEVDRAALDKVLDEADVLTGQFRHQHGLPTAAPFRVSFVARDASGPVGVAHRLRVAVASPASVGERRRPLR